MHIITCYEGLKILLGEDADFVALLVKSFGLDLFGAFANGIFVLLADDQIIGVPLDGFTNDAALLGRQYNGFTAGDR